MATLSLTVVPAKALKDGRHKVRIAVAHNSSTRYIVTDVTLNSIKEWKNGKVVRRDDATYLNTKLLTRMSEVQRIIDDLPYIEGLTCAELVEAITYTKKKKTHTLASAFEEMLEVSSAKESTKKTYRYFFRSITESIPGTTLVTKITPVMIRRFVKAKEGLRPVSRQNLITLITQILNFCQRNGYTDFRTLPTDGSNRYVMAVRQNWLSPDEVRRIRDMELTNKLQVRFRDIFMLSYYLGGINIIDLGRINFNECRDTLRYVRTKTERCPKVNPYVEFGIPDEAKAIINKYKGADGRLVLSNGDIRDYHKSFLAIRFRDSFGLPSLTFYSARKSFAQHAFTLGESESVIDYILGHSLRGRGRGTLFNYIKVTPEMATAAVRRVCDFLAEK